MNHPSPEEWVSFVYNESETEKRQTLQAHLRECEGCRTVLEGWQDTRHLLDRWKAPTQRVALPLVGSPALRWALAASMLLLVGALAGRFSAAASARSIRESVTATVRADLKRDMAGMLHDEIRNATDSSLRTAAQEADQIAAAYVKGLQVQRAEDRRVIESAIERLETQRVTDLAYLKRELDTLAINTDAG